MYPKIMRLVEQGRKYKTALAGAAIIIGCMLLLFCHSLPGGRSVRLQNQHDEMLLRQLNTIQSQLGLFSSLANDPKQQATFRAIQQALSAVQHSILETAKASDIQKVSSEIASIKDEVDLQMGDIKKAMAFHTGGKQYLAASALPFRVVGVDIIAGLPYVSVDYAHHVLPLSLGETLAGWQVVTANSEAGMAEFVNEKDQYIKTLASN